jgi:Haem-binding domain
VEELMKLLKRIVIGLVVLFIVIQAIRPAKTNPIVDETQTIQANTKVSSEVSAILERACYDCHSNTTTWPWYSQIAPVSWFLVNDVNDGRKNLSFSNWASYDARKAARKLQAMSEKVEKGEMPLKSYLLLHPTAKLSESDKHVLVDWAKQESERILASPATGSQ